MTFGRYNVRSSTQIYNSSIEVADGANTAVGIYCIVTAYKLHKTATQYERCVCVLSVMSNT